MRGDGDDSPAEPLDPRFREVSDLPTRGYAAQPDSSRRTTASSAAMPSGLSLRHGIAANFSPPDSRK